MAGLLALGVALPAIVGFLAGTLELPRNDDWVYRRIALELAQTGVLDLHGVTTMMFGQIVLTQPFLWLSGPEPWGFAAAGIVFAAAAVVCSYLLARQFLPPLRAVIATLLLLLFPAYLAYATSFMTDVPAIAAQFGCLALGAIALDRRPIWNRWLLASAALGCLAFSIREFAIAAPASVLLSAIITEPRRFRAWALAIAVVGFCGFLYLLKSAPGQDAGILVGTGALYLSTYAVSSLSLVLLPAALIGGMWWRHEWTRRDVAIGAELGLLIVGIRLVQLFRDGAMPPVLLGNPSSPWGAPGIPYLIGGRPLLFGETMWAMLGLLALVATVVVLSVGAGIAGAYVRRSDGWKAVVKQMGSPIGPLLFFSVAVVAGLTIYGRQFALFERYYWPLVVPMATLFMYRPNSDSPEAATASPQVGLPVAASMAAFFIIISIVSSMFMLNSFAFDSARWRAGERLVQLGIQPNDVDAGYEWVGFHQPDLPGPYETVPVETFYDTLWPGRRECGIVTSHKTGPTGAAFVGTVGYSLLLITGPDELLYLYRMTSPDCVPRS